MRKVYAVILAILVLALSPGAVAGADPLAQPDSVGITDVEVFRNLAETGDILYVFQLEIEYGSYPEVPASDSFIYRLYASDNTTLLAVDSPYVYSFFETNGYGDTVGSFYFGADDTKPTWGDEVTINVFGSPSYYSPVINTNRTVQAGDYTTSTTEEINREELKNYILLLCDRLESLYQALDIILKASSDSGIVLSVYGEMFFRGAITGLQTLSPNLFFIQVYIPEVITVESYNMTQADEYGTRLDGDDIGLSMDRIGDFVGGSRSAVGMIFLIVGSIGLCFFTIRKGWGIEPGLAVSGIYGVALAIIVGNAIFTIMMIGSLVCAVGITWLLVLKRG